jgi:hypothetical protein
MQRKRYANFDALAAAVASGEFTPADSDWVPPQLIKDMFEVAGKMRKQGTTIEAVPASGSRPPMVMCTLKGGTKLTGRYTIREGRVAEVTVDTTKR